MRKGNTRNGKGKCANNNSARRGNEGRKPRYKGENSRGSGSQEVFSDDSGTNDPMWYALNGQLLSDSASFSFNYPLGTSISDVLASDYRVPGVMALAMAPAIGVSTSAESPINIAARNIYSYVRHANSGHTNYDVPDLMMYLVAMDSLYSLHAFLIRLYGVANTFSQVNRYIPKSVVTTMGVDYDDIIQHLADLRYLINNMSVKIASMAAPASMPYFARHMWLYTNIYQDAPVSKAQLYFYTPAYFYEFQPRTAETGGQLSPVYLSIGEASLTGSRLVNFEHLQYLCNRLIQPVVTDEDMNIMSGDILKAFGADNLVKVITISSDYSVVPTFNVEVLTQIQNTVAVGKPDEDSAIICQEGGVIKFNPRFTCENPSSHPAIYSPLDYYHGYIFNMPVDSPTPAAVMVASRNTVRLRLSSTSTDTGAKHYRLHSCGSEYCVHIRIGKYAENIVPSSSTKYWDYYMSLISMADQDSTDAALKAISDIDKFGMHPTFVAVNRADQWNVIGDMSNYTIMTAQPLARLHETALLSEFDVPQMGAYSLSKR